MAIIKRHPPSTLPAFLTHRIPSTELEAIQSAFCTGSFDAYDPAVKLDISTDDTIGLSAEELRERVDREQQPEQQQGRPAPFLILDEDTQRDGAAWWVDRWADEVLGQGQALREWMREKVEGEVAQRGGRVLLKVRMMMEDIPTFYLNRIYSGVSPILAELPIPYNPHPDPAPTPSYVFDWVNDPPSPPTATVYAKRDECERSRDMAHRGPIMLPDGSRPAEVFRLREEVAKELGLVSEWVVPSWTREDGGRENEVWEGVERGWDLEIEQGWRVER